jgi:BlaI family transcriptional regulator, penicillinase repressor
MFMGKKRQLPRDLSPAQHKIMNCIWQHGELSVSGVCAVLGPRWKVARNTVRTLMARMETKGWLKHREAGRTFLYSAAKPKQATVGEKISDVVERLCGGSVETLMVALIDSRALSDDELGRIRQMLDQERKARKSGD